jgi:glycosyltransferase involved in cell wall biosynthesis
MPAALMVADVVAMPSITPEPFGRVALEAQAMGRPVVAFDHGGATESIRHGETGWLAVPGDADSLAVALQAALDLTPRKRKTLATNGKAIYRSQFFDRDHVSANDENLSAGAGSGGGEPEQQNHKLMIWEC